jgi:hypothetical protein
MELSVVEKPQKRSHVLVEPIYRRQPHETDKQYQLFLIYRDLPWDQRNLKKVSMIATQKDDLKYAHPTVIEASARWSWQKRVDAFELFVQEVHSSHQERAVLELKAEVEMLALRLVRKIARIENIQDPLELADPKIQRDLAVIEALIGKGAAGKFILEAYKTVIGEKLELGPRKTEPLLWKADARAA